MSTSNVPGIEFTPAGIVLPTDAEILAGVQADINEAFGGGLNPALETPQGQLASSESAIISAKNSEIAYITNQVDPQYASGRFQDAIGRIYFLNRKPAVATAVMCTLSGVAGTVVPAGALAQDTSGNIYASTGSCTIGLSGSVEQEFQNLETGPIPCAANTLTKVYQAVSGWDTIDNADAGTVGANVESRADFEYRRKNSVALNSHGSPEAIYANVFEQPDVVDCYVVDNCCGVASFLGEISGTTLTVSASYVGQLCVGSIIAGDGVTGETFIVSFDSGTGGVGTYTVSESQSVSSVLMFSLGRVFGATNYAIAANTVYVAAVGGLDADIARAIWEKKDLGCSTTGNTGETVTDESGYAYPYPTYTINFERPAALPILFAVEIVDDPALPSDVIALVKAAIIAAFTGTDGGSRARIGSAILASRYYGPVTQAVPNISILSILIGTVTANQNKVDVGIDKTPTLDEGDITVTLT